MHHVSLFLLSTPEVCRTGARRSNVFVLPRFLRDPALGLLIYLMLDVTLQLCHLVHVRFGCSSSSLAVFTLIVHLYPHASWTFVEFAHLCTS